MNKKRNGTKFISAAVAASLLAMSGLAPAAPALAAEFTAAPTLQGMPSGGFAPMLQTLANPANLSRFSGVTVQGVEISDVLTQLSRVNLSSQGLLAAAPVFEKLAALPKNASEREVIAAVAAAAAQSRADADAVLAQVRAGFPASRLGAVAEGLKKADFSFALLTAEQRAEVAAASTAVARELSAARSADADRVVRLGTAGWDQRAAAEIPAVLGMESASAPRLARPVAAAPRAAVDAVRAPRAEKAAAKAGFNWKKAAGIAALVVAVPVALFALPQMSPAAIVVAAGVMGSVVLHEAAHLAVLKRLGDDTATKQNYSGNPLKLVDPVGTVAVPIITSAVSSLFGLPVLFGWAKPVPVDFNKLANPQKDAMKVALAGPAANAVLAGLGFAALAIFHPGGAAAAAILSLAKINVVLAAFNMLPLSPQMDGFKVAIGMLPKPLYTKWTENKRLPEAYRSTFTKLYEGPSMILNLVGMDGQGKVNFVTRAITIGAFAAVAIAAHAFIGAPLLLMMLVCSYDYYCIREKIQNEEAVKKLIPIMQGMGSAIARIAEEDDSIQSEINTEEIEHAMKNVFEDILDKVIDSAGFDSLTDDEKWSRFEESYLDAAVESLSRKGMSKDSKEKIREVLRHQYVQEYMGRLRDWIKNEDVWRKWHSPKRKTKNSPAEAAKKKIGAIGGSTAMSVLGVGLIGASLLLPHLGGAALATAGAGLMIGSVAPRKPKSFKEALEDLRLADKELAAMLLLLKDMTLAQKPPLSGRIDELSRAYSGVTGPRGIKESVALVGKPGTGKTAIVEKLAQATVMGQSHEGALSLKKMDGRYVIEVNSTRLMRTEDPAGTLEALIDTLNKLNDEDPRAGNKVILFLDEAHVLFDGEKGKHVANTLKKPVRDGAVSIILATTLDEYKKYVEPDEALKRRFPAIFVDESSVDETLRALENASAWYEQRFGVKVDPGALKAAAELAPKFNTEEYLPGSAFTYFENAVKWADFDLRRDLVSLAIADKMSDLQYAMKKLKEQLQKTDRVTENLKKDEPTTVEFYNLAIRLSQELVELYKEQRSIPTEGKPVVDGDLVGMAISRETGIKSGQLTMGGEPIEKYLKMEEEVGKRVIGQPDAIAAIARSVRQNKAGLSDPKRPLGVYYLTGPTGSGKTHLAKELARFLFDDPEAVVRVDMSEYMEGHSVSKFIGSPPGYVGFESGGQLTEAVRKKPYSVVLFDEIEKAHPQVWLIMLQILGEGRLTDGQGKTTSFKNTIILMTSNLGMHAVDVEPYVKAFEDLRAREKAAAGDRVALLNLQREKLELAERLSVETKQATQAITAQAFKETYPPEFEGRLSAAPIVFNRITPDMALKIADLNLGELRSVLGYAGHEFAWTPGVVKKIVDEGFSVRLGARPLQNAIDRLITQNIATEILKSAQAHGGKVAPSRIEALLDENGEIKLQIKPLPAKEVHKKEAQGAARELFTTVLEATLTAAADSAAPAPTIKVIDEWVNAALSANPETTAAAEETPAQTEAAPVAAPADAPRAETPAAPAAPVATVNTRPGVMTLGAASPLSARATTVAAANADPERKDAGVKAASAQIREALTQAGYSDAVKDALLRTIEDQADPYVGWLKVFVEQAKRAGGAAPSIAFEVDETSARASISRPGALNSRERDLLQRHFTGLAPLDASQARTRAETWNVQDSGSGQRLMLDLHRVLAKLPGAKLGVSETGGSVEYWIEIPKPAAPPAPPVVEAPPAQTAAAQPAAPRPLVAEAAGPAQWDGDTHPAAHSTSLRGLADQQIKTQAAALRARLSELGFGGEARGASVLFLAKVADFLKAGAQDGEAVQSRWSADAAGAQVQLHRSGRGFSDAEIERLKTLIESSAELKAKLEAAGGRIFYGSEELAHGGAGASVWLQLPNTGAVSQGDGQASAAPSDSDAPHRASESGDDAWIMEKIHAALDASGDPLRMWVEYTGDSNSEVDRLVQNGFEEPVVRNENGFKRVTLVAPDFASAARAAVSLAAHHEVRVVEVHPTLRSRIRTGSPDAAPAASPAAPTVTPAPAPTGRATRPTVQFKSDMVRLMRELIRQREERGLALRYSAAEAVAAASSSEDLDWARNDWIRMDSNLEQTGPLIAAAGMVLAKHGRLGEDEERMLAAMKRFSETTSWDHMRPARTRLMNAYAKMLTPGNDRQLSELQARYDRQKESGLPRSEKLHADVVLAMYLALLRNAGPDQFEKLVNRDWDKRVVQQIVDYVQRVNPRYLTDLYREWKTGDSSHQLSGVKKLLAFWAISEHGDADDMRALVQAARDDRWMGSAPELEEKQLIGEALGRMARRLGYDDNLKHDVRLWMREGMGDSGTYTRMVTAVQVAGAVGDLEDLPFLERIIRNATGSTVFQHEMTQYEAAVAWGKIVQREGLVPEYWSVPQNPADPNSRPLLQDWLTHVNSAVNMAAVEALTQFLKFGSPARRPAAPAAEGPAPHPFLRLGSVPDAVTDGRDDATLSTHVAVRGANRALDRLDDATQTLAQQWGDAVQAALRAITNVEFEKQLRTRDVTTGRSVVVYVLKEAATRAVTPEMIGKLRQFFLLLLAMSDDSAAVREQKFAVLERAVPGARAVYEAVTALAAIPGVTMGLDRRESRATSAQRGETEVWLRFEVPNRPEAVTPPRPSNPRFRDDEDGGSGHMLF